MAKQGQKIRKRLARDAGKRCVSDLTDGDINRLWSKRLSRPEKYDEELHELFKITAARLRDRITVASNVCHWSEVTLRMMEDFPKEGLTKCQNVVLDELVDGKRDRKVKKQIPIGQEATHVGRVNKPLSKTTSSTAAPKQSAVRVAYNKSNATKTRQLYRQLENKGWDGKIAAELLRVQKSSSRAKRYKGDYKDYAYDRKSESLDQLCKLLHKSNHRWGWGEDSDQNYARYVLYVDLPEGQVSFHSTNRGGGPEYPSSWDGQRSTSEERIVRFAERCLEEDAGE